MVKVSIYIYKTLKNSRSLNIIGLYFEICSGRIEMFVLFKRKSRRFYCRYFVNSGGSNIFGNLQWFRRPRLSSFDNGRSLLLFFFVCLNNKYYNRQSAHVNEGMSGLLKGRSFLLFFTRTRIIIFSMGHFFLSLSFPITTVGRGPNSRH